MKKELKDIEMKNDGKDLERFQTLLKTVVAVPKKDVQAQEERQKKKAKRKA